MQPQSSFEPVAVDDYAAGSDAWNVEEQSDGDIQRQEAAREEARAFAAAPEVLAANAEWFATAVNDCDNINNVQVTEIVVDGVTYSRKVSVEAQVLAYQLLKAKLLEKANEYSRFMEDA